MKTKKIINNHNLFKFIIFVIIFFIVSIPISAQDSNTLDKIIKANEFLLKADMNIIISFNYIFDYFPSNPNWNFFNIFYQFNFSYELFNWLDFNFILSLSIGPEEWFLNPPYLYFNVYFNEIFSSLPFQSDIKLGLFSKDFSIASNFYGEGENPFYYGIAPFYISYELGAVLLNIKWWLFEFSSGIFGFDESTAFFKLVFSFYDFAYLSVSSFVPVKISQPNMASPAIIELALAAGLFDILAYFLPMNYYDTTYNQNMPAYSFGINISSTFMIANSHKLKIVLFGDYNDPHSLDSFELIDYLNELYFTSNYSFAQKHPSRAGLGIEYDGSFSKNLSLNLVTYFYYNFSLNSIVFNVFSKVKFYYFYAEINYFPYYYPDIFLNTFEISVGVDFSL